jgi:hypothetical protein
MANSTFRVGGNYTAFVYKGQQLAYAQVITERAPRPYADPQPIQPLDSPYPIEIALPAALTAGTLEIQFYEQWDSEVWAQLGGEFTTASDLLDVFKAQLAQGEVQCIKIINKPDGTQRRIVYQGCSVTNVTIDEQITIGTMTVPKTISIMYRSRKELTQ